MKLNIVRTTVMLLILAVLSASFMMIFPVEETQARTWHECFEVLCYVHDNMDWECFAFYWEVRHPHLGAHSWDPCS